MFVLLQEGGSHLNWISKELMEYYKLTVAAHHPFDTPKLLKHEDREIKSQGTVVLSWLPNGLPQQYMMRNEFHVAEDDHAPDLVISDDTYSKVTHLREMSSSTFEDLTSMQCRQPTPKFLLPSITR